MSEKYPWGVGAAGRWLIFAGIPWTVLALFIVCGPHFLEGVVGSRALPYAIYGISAAIVIGAMVLYNHFPRRMVIPLGIAGWVITFTLLFWYYWFGPGALKM